MGEYKLLITVITKDYHSIEVGYGTYRKGSLAAMASSTATATYTHKQDADKAFDVLRHTSGIEVVKLYE